MLISPEIRRQLGKLLDIRAVCLLIVLGELDGFLPVRKGSDTHASQGKI